MTEFSPREIVSELDRFIIGQADAKRAVAIALRNRWRRRRLEGPIKDEVTPKNILMSAMSAATWSRSCAIWSKSPSVWCASADAKR